MFQGDTFDWAGLEDRVDLEGYVEPSAARSLVGYFRDCAIATQRGLNLRDVFDDRDAQVLSVPPDAWEAGIGEGFTVDGKAAVDLAVANQVNPQEKPLVMGVLFVVGRYAKATRRTQTYCAPLLVAAVSQTSDAASASFFIEGDVALNLSLLASLCDVDALFAAKGRSLPKWWGADGNLCMAGTPSVPFADSDPPEHLVERLVRRMRSDVQAKSLERAVLEGHHKMTTRAARPVGIGREGDAVLPNEVA